MSERQVCIPRSLIRWTLAGLFTIAIVLLALNLLKVVGNVQDISKVQAVACHLAATSRATLVRLIDVPHNAPGGPAAYYARQRKFYASINFSPAQTEALLRESASARADQLALLGDPEPCP